MQKITSFRKQLLQNIAAIGGSTITVNSAVCTITVLY